MSGLIISKKMIEERRKTHVRYLLSEDNEIIEELECEGREREKGQKGETKAIIPSSLLDHSIDLDASPYLPNGWSAEEHKKGGFLKWDPTKVRLHFSENQQGGKYVEGNKLRKELETQPVYNANLLDFYLAHPELIPEEWKGKSVFFWGTIYRLSDGRLYVRYLYFLGGQWGWDYYWLDHDWSSSAPAAVPASQ